MARALQEAGRGLYSTDPNPRVGCLLVKDGAVIGSGWHKLAGDQHAEVEAISSAEADVRGATAYVTLEPCSHEGRTGACCKVLAEAGISRVVAAMVDPFPEVAGKGFEYLRTAGIEVTTSLLEDQARALNPGYVKRLEQGLPFVRCKLATSLDGRTALANGNSKWISGADARRDVQRLRARSSAIVTGIGTVLADDPSLTVRAGELDIASADLALQRQPLRVVLDPELQIEPAAKLLQQPGHTLLVCTDAGATRQAALVDQGLEIVKLTGDENGVDLTELLTHLAARDCNEVLFETGATLAGALIRSGMMDELVIYMAARLLGNDALPLAMLPEISCMNEAIDLQFTDVRHIGADIRLTASVQSR
jgi:diaminohydroxyphosphoribosylaminopyrimidine deaminase/5-amino-6-(5-phosphoribosylamino)uracil reductase|tara:strand:+ start:550 stop:1644 length:1095 start_codon:yes stop_codon:yes gene_type:complete